MNRAFHLGTDGCEIPPEGSAGNRKQAYCQWSVDRENNKNLRDDTYHSSKTMVLISIQACDHLKMGLGACIEVNMHLDGSVSWDLSPEILLGLWVDTT